MKLRALAYPLCSAFVVAFSGIAAAADTEDVVLYWNEIEQQTVAKVNPLMQSRSMAITQTAVLEAVTKAASVPGASPDAAAMVAAHDTLAALHPDGAEVLGTALSSGLANVNDGHTNAAVPIAKAAAAGILSRRKSDGWDAKVAFENHPQPRPLGADTTTASPGSWCAMGKNPAFCA